MKTYSKDKQGSRATSSILSNAILLIIGEAIEFANACAEAKATLPFETIEQSMIQISQTLAAPTSIERVKLENPTPLPEFQALKTKSPITRQETQLLQHAEREQVTNIPKPVRTEVHETLDKNHTHIISSFPSQQSMADVNVRIFDIQKMTKLSSIK